MGGITSKNIGPFQYKNVITEIIEKIPSTDINKHINYTFYKSNGSCDLYNISFGRYLWLLYQTVDRSSLSLVEFIYNSIINDNGTCTEKIDLNLSTKIVKLNEVSIDYSEEMSPKLIKNIAVLIEKIKLCRFSPISVKVTAKKTNGTIGFHRNMIFAEYVPENNIIILNYYEPHGSYKGFSEKYGVFDFLNELQDLSSDMETKLVYNYRDVGCPSGLQRYLKDYDIGFCVLFSLFWLYLVLKIVDKNIKDGTYVSSDKWIDEIENYILSYNKDYLFVKIISFGYELLNNYLNYIVPTQKLLYNDLQKRAINTIIKKGLKPVKTNINCDKGDKEEIKIESEEPYYTAEDLKYESKIDPEKTYEAYILEERKEIGKIGKRLGDICLKNNECISKRCDYDEFSGSKKYCRPSIRSGGSRSDGNSPTRSPVRNSPNRNSPNGRIVKKMRGRKCKANSECLSGACVCKGEKCIWKECK